MALVIFTFIILHSLTRVCPAPTMTPKYVEHGALDMNSSFTNEKLWPRMDLSLNLVSQEFEKDIGLLFINEQQGRRKIQNSGTNEYENSEYTASYDDTTSPRLDLLYYFISRITP